MHHIIICLGIASSLMLWFKADLPVSLTKLSRWAVDRWANPPADFWPDDIEYKFWIRNQWGTWLGLKAAKANLPVRLFIHLITCPYCCSFHLSWMAGLGIGLVTGNWVDASVCVAYPVVAIFILNRTTV